MDLGKPTMQTPTMITMTGMINHNRIRIIILISLIIKLKEMIDLVMRRVTIMVALGSQRQTSRRPWILIAMFTPIMP